jgi:TRAP-type uncharacterized transport system substrate-binding protein
MRYIFFLLALLIPFTVSAQTKQFTVAQGSVTGTYGVAFGELANACSTESLPLVPAFPDGKGDGATNLASIVDGKAQAAFVRNDVIFFNGREGQLSYIKTLFTLWEETVHLVAAVQTSVSTKKWGVTMNDVVTLNTIYDLNGRRLGAVGANNVTANVIRSQTGINFEILPMVDAATAISALKAGQVDALIFTAGTPAPTVSKMGAGFKLLAIPPDAAKKLEMVYRPATVTYTQLTNSMGVPTVKADSIFVTKVVNTETRVKQLAELRSCFLKRLGELKDDGSALWQNVDPQNRGKWAWYDLPEAKATKPVSQHR